MGLIPFLSPISIVQQIELDLINMPAVCVKDVDQQAFVKAFAAFLKKSGKVKVPSWADQVKTAVFKELSPYDQDWYYVRCASLARHLYMRGNAGVGAFRKVYGGSKDNGFAPSHFRVANGNIIRKCLQSLEAIKLVKKSDFRGRCVTPQGQRDMDRVAAMIYAPAAAPVVAE